MSALPVYEVNFMPLERRWNDRRVAPYNAALPVGVIHDRRFIFSRRSEDRKTAYLKPV